MLNFDGFISGKFSIISHQFFFSVANFSRSVNYPYRLNCNEHCRLIFKIKITQPRIFRKWVLIETRLTLLRSAEVGDVFPAFVSRRRKITSAKTKPQTISMTSFFLDQSQFGSEKFRTKHACLA